MRRSISLLLLALVIGVLLWQRQQNPPLTLPPPAAPATYAPPAGLPSSTPPDAAAPSDTTQSDPALPAEARHTLALIASGGPFVHRQDGGVFGNREGRLPRQPRGWYREYTVDTPGVGHRGARRIVTGGRPPSEWYYTDDHYDSFRQFEVSR